MYDSSVAVIFMHHFREREYFKKKIQVWNLFYGI